MIDIGDFNINRRSKFRAKTKLNAQYFIKKQSSQYLDCQIVNLSRTGAAVSLPLTEKLEVRQSLCFLISIYRKHLCMSRLRLKSSALNKGRRKLSAASSSQS